MFEDAEPYIVWDEDMCKFKIRNVVDFPNCHCVSLLQLFIFASLLDDVIDSQCHHEGEGDAEHHHLRGCY